MVKRLLLLLVLCAGCARPVPSPVPVVPPITNPAGPLDQQAQKAEAYDDPTHPWATLSEEDKQAWRNYVAALLAWEKESGFTYPWQWI